MSSGSVVVFGGFRSVYVCIYEVFHMVIAILYVSVMIRIFTVVNVLVEQGTFIGC